MTTDQEKKILVEISFSFISYLPSIFHFNISPGKDLNRYKGPIHLLHRLLLLQSAAACGTVAIACLAHVQRDRTCRVYCQ